MLKHAFAVTFSILRRLFSVSNIDTVPPLRTSVLCKKLKHVRSAAADERESIVQMYN